jgi:hypothetical protein
MGAGAGNCGAAADCATLVPDPPVAGADGVVAGASDAAGIGTGATIAVRLGISARLRNCFFESAASREGEELVDLDGKLPNIGWIIESSICAGNSVVGVAGSFGTRDVETLFNPDEGLPNIERIIESASSAGDAVTTGVFAAVTNGEVA